MQLLRRHDGLGPRWQMHLLVGRHVEEEIGVLRRRILGAVRARVAQHHQHGPLGFGLLRRSENYQNLNLQKFHTTNNHCIALRNNINFSCKVVSQDSNLEMQLICIDDLLLARQEQFLNPLFPWYREEIEARRW